MKRRAGFTLVELMIALVVFGIVSSGAMAFFHTHRQVAAAEDIRSTLNANLRIAMVRIIDTFRNAGYGLPPSDRAAWIAWVPGHGGGAVEIADGAGTDPDALSIVACTTAAVAVLSSDTTVGAFTVLLDDASAFDTATRRTLLIDGAEHAHVTHAAGTTLTLDTDPVTAGAQSLGRAYPAGTPLCRLDVQSFAVDTATRTLLRNTHDGTGFHALVDEIDNLQIETLVANERYRVTLSARSVRRDPIRGTFPTLTMSSTVTLKNRP